MNALGGIASIAFAFGDAGVTSGAGYLPSYVIMPVFALFFAARFAGVTAGIWRGAKEMPWAYRGASWAALALAFLLLAALPSWEGLVALGAFVALDALAHVSKRRPGERKGVRAARLVAWASARRALLAVLWVAGLAAVHFLYAVTVPFGPLVDWCYIAIGFALFVRFALPGARATESAALPPAPHRVHVAAPRDLGDPLAGGVADACNVFLSDGDVGLLLAEVRATAAHAGLAPDEARALESRVLAAMARAGTSRQDDLDAAVAEFERGIADSAGLKTRRNVGGSA